MESILNSILQELKGINGRLDSLENRMTSFENRMTSFEDRMITLEQGQVEIRKDLTELKESHLELKSGIIDNFGIFNESIEELVEDRTHTLNKRMYNIETDIQKIMRLQKTV